MSVKESQNYLGPYLTVYIAVEPLYNGAALSQGLICNNAFAEGIITACHLTFAGPKGQMSDQYLVWSDILANEIN